MLCQQLGRGAMDTTNSGEAIEVLGTKELLYEHSESTTGLQTHGEWT